MDLLYRPSIKGRFGEFGGCYVPELLIRPLQELSAAFVALTKDVAFKEYFLNLLQNYAGRPTPLTLADQFRDAINGPKIYLKREDLLHTGAHKLNNALAQCLLAKQLGKKRIIAETGAGQHGVATATACARLGLNCVVYMGAVDMQRQAPNVQRMKLLGAQIVPVTSGTKTLKDAVNAALRDWAEHYETSHYCLGSALGPYPYPEMVAYFQSVIGCETKEQILDAEGKLPSAIVACVGGGSNAIGIFSPFIDDVTVSLIGVEAGGKNLTLGNHAARLSGGSPGVLHGSYSYILQNASGQIAETHSISAGLDYPSIGPQHADLYTRNRATYVAVDDQHALKACHLLAKTEGIIAALESSHALGFIKQHAAEFSKEDVIIISLSGRGDKDLAQIAEL